VLEQGVYTTYWFGPFIISERRTNKFAQLCMLTRRNRLNTLVDCCSRKRAQKAVGQLPLRSKDGASPGIEPGTSRTRSENHTTRPRGHSKQMDPHTISQTRPYRQYHAANARTRAAPARTSHVATHSYPPMPQIMRTRSATDPPTYPSADRLSAPAMPRSPKLSTLPASHGPLLALQTSVAAGVAIARRLQQL